VKSPRNIDDEQLDAVADAGGVAGVIFAPWWNGKGTFSEDAEGIVDAICYAADRVGADHVGLGSDIDGFLVRLNEGIKDISAMPVVTELLLRRNRTPEEIKKILGGNFLRVYRDVHAARG
jgi:membrane dipeptidase